MSRSLAVLMFVVSIFAVNVPFASTAQAHPGHRHFNYCHAHRHRHWVRVHGHWRWVSHYHRHCHGAHGGHH